MDAPATPNEVPRIRFSGLPPTDIWLDANTSIRSLISKSAWSATRLPVNSWDYFLRSNSRSRTIEVFRASFWKLPRRNYRRRSSQLMEEIWKSEWFMRNSRGAEISTQLLLWYGHSGFINSLSLQVQLNWNYDLQLAIDIDKFLATAENDIARNLWISVLSW